MSALLSKIVAVIMAIFAMFTGGNMENVTLAVTNEVTTKSETIVIELENFSGKTFYIGEEFACEKKVDGEWVAVELSGSFIQIATQVNLFGKYTQTIKVADYFPNGLEAGDYRISKSLPGDITCSTEFTVTQA